MRWMGDYLAEEGFSVLAIRLFAHGTDQSDMLRARWQDWLASAEDGLHLLDDICKTVVVMGLSMGSILALQLGISSSVDGVVAMAVPYSLSINLRLRLVRPFLRPISWVWKYYRKAGHREEQHLSYPVNPVRGVAEADSLLALHRRTLPSLKIPTLIVHSRNDPTIPARHAEQIYDLIGSEDKHLQWVDGGHVIVRDEGRDQVFRAASRFAKKVAVAHA
jgi:carboxylesterase